MVRRRRSRFVQWVARRGRCIRNSFCSCPLSAVVLSLLSRADDNSDGCRFGGYRRITIRDGRN